MYLGLYPYPYSFRCMYLAPPALGLAVQVVAPTLAGVGVDTMFAKLGCICGSVVEGAAGRNV